MEAPTADTEAPGAHLTGTARAWIMVSLLIAILPLQLDALVTATAVPTVVGDLGGSHRSHGYPPCTCSPWRSARWSPGGWAICSAARRSICSR